MQKNSLTMGRRRLPESLFCIALLTLLLFFSSSPIDTVKRALLLCYTTVIPAIFPFMIVSTLLLRTSAHKVVGALLSGPLRLIFGCSKNASVAVALGYLSGFPIGSLSAATLYNNGEITKGELKRLLLFINNPSAAFVVGGVGIGILGSEKAGRILYLSVLIPSLLVGILSRFFFCEYDDKENHAKPQSIEKGDSFALVFTRSVGESAINMLTVCACVVFFSIPVGIIGEIFENPGLCTILSAFFEISGGCWAASGLSSKTQMLMLCAVACSWSGLSVHMQIFSVLEKCDLTFKPYLISKLAQSLISPLLVYLFSRGAHDLTLAESQSVAASPVFQVGFTLLFIVSVVAMGVLYSLKRVSQRRA